MGNSERLTAIRAIWNAFGAAMFVMFISLIFTGASLSVGYVVIAIVVSLAAFLSTAVVWSVSTAVGAEQQTAKNKREASDGLDAVLERLSDDELMALRDRLSDNQGAIGLSDDGELIRRQ